MKQLLKYLKDYRKESIIGPLFKLLEASFELLIPLVMASIIDVGIKNNDVSHIIKMGGIMIFLGILGLACSLTAQYFAAKAAVGFGTALRKDMFNHINTLSYSEIDTISTSTLITRITGDINKVQSGVNLVLRLFLRSPFIVVGAMVMAFTIDAKVAMIFLVAVPILSLLIYGIMIISIPIYKRVQKSLDKVLLATRENLTGVRVIRAFGKQEYEKERFDDSSDQLMKVQLLVGRISAFLNPGTYIVVNGAIIAILWFGGKRVYEGVITQGQVVALVNYMSQILLALVALANLIISFTRAVASASRINEVFSYKSSIDDSGNTNKGNPDAPKIEFRHVDFKYANAKEESLFDISFTIQRGETVGITGSTGAGKSTLINLMPRFYDTTKGEILINGVDVKDYALNQLRKKFGIVPQYAQLFKGTVRENMQWGDRNASDKEIIKALEIAQAKDFIDNSENGLDTMIMQGGKNLSGGQRQRLTIARALLRNPEILILDDSASALDYATDARLRKAISEYSKGEMTVLIVSQRPSTIKHADKIIVLEDGKMVGCGEHKELLDTSTVYKEISSSQLSKEEVQEA